MVDPDRIRRNVPSDLLQLRQWVGWKYVRRDGRETKLPIDPKTGGPASSTDPTTWASFDDAVAACRRYAAMAGVGFVFTADDEFCGIDLDDCIDPATGGMKPWGLRMLRTLNSYSEISPSGKGVKVFVRGRKPGPHCKKPFEDGAIEIYDSVRFFTITGQRIDEVSHDIEMRQAELDAMYFGVFCDGSTSPKTKSPRSGVPLPVLDEPASSETDEPPPVLTDDEILDLAMSPRRKERSEKFAELWAGKWNDYFKSVSEADSSVCFTLAYYTKDVAQIDRLFRRSGLFRPKWDERRGGDTYGKLTVAKALEHVTEQYRPKKRCKVPPPKPDGGPPDSLPPLYAYDETRI